jgi:putative DNA primase/helicase
VEAELYRFTEEAVYLAKGERLGWLPNRRKIGDLLGALAAVCIMPDGLDQPCWLDGQERSGTIVAAANGLLDIETQTLLPHTPNFFNQTSVPFAYDPDAPEPA